jgi:hypothetical protein
MLRSTPCFPIHEHATMGSHNGLIDVAFQVPDYWTMQRLHDLSDGLGALIPTVKLQAFSGILDSKSLQLQNFDAFPSLWWMKQPV